MKGKEVLGAECVCPGGSGKSGPGSRAKDAGRPDVAMAASDREGSTRAQSCTGGELFGRWLLGSLLTFCTLGIYGAWLYSNIWAWTWENTDGGRATLRVPA